MRILFRLQCTLKSEGSAVDWRGSRNEETIEILETLGNGITRLS
jgi:hypothetical protein